LGQIVRNNSYKTPVAILYTTYFMANFRKFDKSNDERSNSSKNEYPKPSQTRNSENRKTADRRSSGDSNGNKEVRPQRNDDRRPQDGRPFGGSDRHRDVRPNRSNDRRPQGDRSFGGSDRQREERPNRNDDRKPQGDHSFGRADRQRDDRPNRNDDRKPQGDRSFRGSDRQRDDRPNRNDDRRPQGDRSFGGSDRQRDNRPNRNDDRRPQGGRSFGTSDRQRDDRPNRNDDRKPQGDRPFGKPDRANDNRNRDSRESRDRNRQENNDRPFRGKPQGRGKTERSGFSKEERPRNNSPEFKKFKPNTDRQVGPQNAPRYDEAALRAKMPERLKEKIESVTAVLEIRLNKYIANSGLCSRREADELIESGMIKVNGEVVTEMGYKVKDSDTIKYGKDILSRERMMYILLNKPKDFITTMDDPQERKTVIDLVAGACKERVYPVGRLDRNTTGLLLLTNDGELTKKLTHPTSNIKKIYQAELDKAITEEHFELIKEGLELEDGFIKPDQIALVTPDAEVVGVEIHSGKNRIVRRMFEHLGYDVTKLDRTTFAGLTKKDLPRGKWRFLNEKELIRLKYML
jgi:23S rRNA pseudouridine2605 synthase